MATINGNNQGNTLNGGGNRDTINGRGGNDLIHGNGGDDLVNGDAGNDRLYGDLGADTLNGGADNDILFGGAGADTMNGGSGLDVLHSDGGSDVMTGGSGADTFVFTLGSSGAVVITDFQDGVDKLDFSAFNLDQQGYGDVYGFLASYGSDTVLEVYNSATNDLFLTIRLQGFSHTNIGIDDYIL